MLPSYYPRFSLLSLLLCVTLAAVGVSHWLTNRQLHGVRRERDNYQRTIRGLNDELGRLMVEDSSRVNVMALFNPLHVPSGYGPAFAKQDNFGWRVHLPPSTRWRLCASFAAIPASGFPPPAGDLALPVGDGRICDIYFVCRKSSSLGWVAELALGDQVEHCFITAPHAGWLTSEGWFEGECAGEYPQGDQHRLCTESYAADKRVVLLRQRAMREPTVANRGWISDPNSCQGVLIWLEPWPIAMRHDP